MMQDYAEFWETVRAHAARAAQEAAPPFVAWAVTTGDAAVNETIGSTTTRRVAVWLNGIDQTTDNKVSVALQHGQTVPAAGELWLVLLPNYQPPGVLLLRLA